MDIKNLTWVEKYRPQKIEELILENKDNIKNFLNYPSIFPSFIFYSSKPGTGKTSTAKVIIKHLGCDFKIINSSDERGIDTIREEVNIYARSLSTDGKKRCIFMDEADGLTKPAQDSLRNLMETHCNNCFFIFSCNDISKIIEPIRSRCVLINFEKPNEDQIVKRLEYICQQEQLEYDINDLILLSDYYYPDIRSMVKTLQECKINGTPIIVNYENEFEKLIHCIQKGDINSIYTSIYQGETKLVNFNKYFFDYLRKNWQKYGLNKVSRIANLLADNEKAYNQNCNIEIVFTANFLEISRIFQNI